MPASYIIAMETAQARALGSSNNIRLPIPDEKTRAALVVKGVVFGNVLDKVLISATLPSGWSIQRAPDTSDERYRILYADTGAGITSIFIKNSGYDYYGRISMM